ncbi:FecR domain-containing protein [Bordetella sp. 02P26C-1]|uniref:FecR domain-containing protein n=1 Tax=unclassified Bordetella TaxID=2630031 RepID=UPI001365D9B0
MSATPPCPQRTAIQEAARWFALLQAPQADEATRTAWRQWLARDAVNRNAWAKVEAVQQQFGAVPAQIAVPALQGVDRARRRLMGGAITGVAAVAIGSWFAKDANRAHWTADYRNAVGEITPLPLPDGTVAILDTRSAADVEYSPTVRRIVLRAGRLYAKTHTDTMARARPFIVRTRHGDVEALGTEFMVRVTDAHSKVWVNEDAVRITPRNPSATPLILNAGQRVSFAAGGFDSEARAADETLAMGEFASWRNGSLIATNMPLSHLVERFRAYHRGYLFLDGSLAHLPVSGVFPLGNTDLALAALENIYPVRIRHATRFFTWIEPREA